MRKFVVVMMMVVSVPALANSLHVSVSNVDAKNISLSWFTNQTFSSICTMAVNQLNLKRAIRGNFGQPARRGSIQISTSTDLMAPCLMAFGPHRGGLTMQRGRGLPALTDGTYNLVIDGENYGVLNIAGDSAELDKEAAELDVFEGIVSTDIVAIGGETTGVILYTDNDGIIELYFDDLHVDHLNGKRVRVAGQLRVFSGIEVGLRRVLTVQDIEVLAD